MEAIPHEALAALTPTQLFLFMISLMVGLPLVNRLIASIERRFSKQESRENQLVSRLLNIIDAKFDKLADSVNNLAGEIRASHKSDLAGKR